MLVCALFVHIAHETAGAARIRHSLRPFLRGRELPVNLGRLALRDRWCLQRRSFVLALAFLLVYNVTSGSIVPHSNESKNPMARVRCITEMGMGVDVHGEDS